MVKVTYKPWEEVIIHESIQHSLDDLVKMQSLGVPAGGLGNRLLWAEGIAFKHSGMPPTDDVVKEQLQGIVHWSAVEWALMPKYENAIIIRETNVRVPVIDVSTNPFLKTVAKWLKGQTGVKHE
jgi:hypothetical protein